MRHAATLPLHTHWLSRLTGGLVIGFVEVIIALSLASLIFSGPLQSSLPRGIGIMLITCAVHLAFTSVFSSATAVISSVQDNPATLMAVAVAAVIAQMPANGPVVPTVLALDFLVTVLAGGLITLLGVFRLGRLVRYIPYPVIGGFVGGAGWLLAQGSIGAMASYPLRLDTLSGLLSADQIVLWLPGVIFALVLFFGLHLIKHALALPALLFGGLVVFFAVLVLTGTSIESATARGLLLGSGGQQVIWQPLPFTDLARADWAALSAQIANVGAILAMTTISLLLNLSGLEVALRQDFDLNRELRRVGAANLLSGLAGGAIGYPALSLTALNQRMGSASRWTGLIASVFCLAILIGGAPVLAYVPRPLLGGLLLFLGLNFIDEWVVQGFRRLEIPDYLVVLFIIGVVAIAGFIAGLSVGLFLTVVLFVVQSSQVNIFRSAVHGDEVISNVLRNAREQRVLNPRKRGIYILELQGFIFFGTATAILEKVRQRVSLPEAPPLEYLLIDFRHVIGLDSSAVYSLKKVKYLADTKGFELIFTHLSRRWQYILARSEMMPDDRTHWFEDMHRGLEWCENRLLKTALDERAMAPRSLALELVDFGLIESDAARLVGRLDRIQLGPDDTLIGEGELSNDLYFIENGQLSAYITMNGGRRVRIQSLRPGSIVGELAFLLDIPRTASIVADVASVVYRLQRKTLDQITAEDLPLAVAINRLIGRLLSERVAATDRERAAFNR